MRERVRDIERLRHILNAIDDIQSNKEKFTFQDICESSIIYYGFVKEVEIIGEAVYMLTKEFRASHPQCEWDVIENMRHVLVHGYYKINREQLWDTVQNDIPELRPLIEELIEEQEKLGY